MYRVIKEIWVSASHNLKLNYLSKCENIHGHNWKMRIYCESGTLDRNGMVIDFCKISEIARVLDHACVNEFVEQPTAENIAAWVCNKVGKLCYKVEVWETESNLVIYEREN
jgi:6-pyruvoyltetrahydropterin/6-carboxytetrahydropterin synthase